MEEQKTDSVQPEVSDLNSEKLENNPLDDYKKDMFKFKNKFKESESEKESLKQKLKEYELAEKERQGNFQEVIDDLKKQLSDARNESVSSSAKFAHAKVKNAIESYAKDNGCKDTEAFLKLLGNGYLEAVQLDKETFDVNLDDVKLVVDNGMKKYEHLGIFGKKVNVVDRSPNNQPLNMPQKPRSEMTADELKQEILKRFG